MPFLSRYTSLLELETCRQLLRKLLLDEMVPQPLSIISVAKLMEAFSHFRLAMKTLAMACTKGGSIIAEIPHNIIATISLANGSFGFLFISGVGRQHLIKMSSITTTEVDDYAAGGVVIPLAIIFVALRFYTRFITKAGLSWDDWLILVSVIFMAVTAIILIYANAIDSNGVVASQNMDPDYVYTDQDHYYLELSFLPSIFYFTIVGSTKLSILLMYNRVFFVDNVFRHQLIGACILVVSFWIGCTVATLTNCIPLYQSWWTTLPNPKYCFNFNTFWVASGSVEVAIDLIILTLPIQVIHKMELSIKKKITVACIFLLGGL
jgi:hypothetical protein